MSTPKVTVSTEAVAFEALKLLAQDLYDTHGLLLQSAHISWDDVSAYGKAAFRVREVDASLGRKT